MQDFNKIYKKKLGTVEDGLALIKDDFVIVSALCAVEAQGMLEKLHTVKDRVKGVEVYMCLPMKNYEFFADPKCEGHINLISWFHTPGVRNIIKKEKRVIPYQPNHLYLASRDLLSWRKINIFLGACTPPDHTGHISLSCSLPFEKEILEAADIVILEVNEKLPRCHGDTHVRVDKVTLFYERTATVPALDTPKPNEKDTKIGQFCADLVQNGSTLQLGIGGIPNACALALIEANKKHLGVHTEMFVDSMVDLYYAGVIDNSAKTLMKDKFVATFALGTQKVYDFIHDNMAVEIHRGKWVIDPHTISKNRQMVSINSCLMVDLTGNVASESIGPFQYSGTGGQFATHTGARECEVGGIGAGILTTYSTAMVDGKPESKIVPMLTEGSTVTTHRSSVDHIITEYGVAHLRGRDVKRRALNLIEIAHPDFRPWLREEAKRLQFI
jgi:acyl-CoA hydrolase